jgi:hypothetical protein
VGELPRDLPLFDLTIGAHLKVIFTNFEYMENTSPQIKTKTKRPIYKRWWFWVIAVVAFFIFIGNLGSKLPDQPATQANQPAKSVSETKPTQPTYVFDIPSLLGKNIEELRQTLGEPVDKQKDLTPQQLSLGGAVWWNEWDKDGYHLTAEFDANTRKVKNLFIDFKEGQDRKNPDLLLPVGNLNKKSTSYKIDPVKEIKNPGYYTGITITAR